MKEVYLYACEVCDTVRISSSDVLKMWCVMCQACKECQFHYKVSPLIDKGCFYGFGIEEKNNDSVGGSKTSKKD